MTNSWYVRDASGSLLSLYEEDVETGEPAEQAEVPIYGADRIGLYKPNASFNNYLYEISDHLGNVRAVVGEEVTLEYLATMEKERDMEEELELNGAFENIHRISTADRINHTSSTVTVDGEEYSIDDPNQVVRLNGYHNISEGPGILLPVSPGDRLEIEVYVKYLDLRRDDGIGAAALLAYLMGGMTSSGFAYTPVDGGGALITDQVNNISALIGATSDIATGTPAAILARLKPNNRLKSVFKSTFWQSVHT